MRRKFKNGNPSVTMMNTKNEVPKDPDIIGSERALLRAAKTAQLLARQNNTPCYVMKDGKTVDLTQQNPE